MNDLSYVLIPFDKTNKHFIDLVFRIKQLLKNQNGPIKLYDIVEGIFRLKIDSGIT